MKIIGIDIGTTTICAIVVDSGTGSLLHSLTVGNDTAIKSRKSFERTQSPEKILQKCTDIVDELTAKFSPIACIGVTGQMHGIVYLDKKGDAISPLYYWQDESGNEMYKDGKSYAEYLSTLTQYKMATGFGATTYFYHKTNNLVPPGACKICTIHDYVAMKLCKKSEPLMHTSDAASLGLFNLKELSFDREAIKKCGLDLNLFPTVTKSFDTVGFYNDTIPVSVAIGDNQASFFGSVSNFKDCILVNVGTGSQISFLTEFTDTIDATELRPCYGDNFLCVGSSLCGGRAFAILESFLKSTVKLISGEDIKSAYPAMDKFLHESQIPENPIKVSTKFCGTRACPNERGTITNLDADNFTPETLIWGFLSGIVDELKSMYPFTQKSHHTVLVGSGNGLRKNKALQLLFAQSFGMELKIPLNCEEAAFGAALFGMTAAGIFENIEQAQELIKYI